MNYFYLLDLLYSNRMKMTNTLGVTVLLLLTAHFKPAFSVVGCTDFFQLTLSPHLQYRCSSSKGQCRVTYFYKCIL